MIDLFSVKINGEYNEIGAIPTIENGIFLCDTDSEIYKRGFTYQIGDPTVHRIETVTDYKIEQAIYPTIQNVCEWLNNWFVARRNYLNFFSSDYGTSGRWHDVPQTPASGDLCKVRTTDNWQYISQYNSFFVSYVIVDSEGIITCDNPQFKEGQNYFYYVMHLPQDVEKAISQMIYYDIFTRGTVDGLKSESVGNYSYTREDETVGSLAYPKALIAGLEANYKKVRFVQ